MALKIEGAHNFIYFMPVPSSPLVDVAVSYVADMNSNLSNYDLNILRSAFDSYINNQITYDECVPIVSHYCENMSPLERLDAILNVPEDPPVEDIPSDNEKSGSRRKTRSWNPAEDMRLMKGVHKFGLENWSLVASFVGNGRNRSMCSQRWIRVLDPRISKNHWTPEEEQKLIQYVQMFGEKSWMKVATKLGNRSDVQCRYRYMQLVRGGSPSQTSSPDSTPAPKSHPKKNTKQQTKHIMPEIPCLPLPAIENSTISAQISEPQILLESTHAKPTVKFTPISELEAPLKLDDPMRFSLGSSFDLFKSDNMFDSSFWVI